MGKEIAPYREGLVLKITQGEHSGFTGEVVMVEEDALLLVDRGTRETHWFNIYQRNQTYGAKNWFEWIETATTPIQVLDDLIRDWESDYHKGFKVSREEVVDTLKEAMERIRNISTETVNFNLGNPKNPIPQFRKGSCNF